MEHLSEPELALGEMFRVLRPQGVIGLSSPDWGGFILSPPSNKLCNAVQEYMALQTRNGGDVEVGRKLGIYLGNAGFETVEMSARYNPI